MSRTAEKIKAEFGISDKKFNADDYVVVKHGEESRFPSYKAIGEIPDATRNQDGTMVVMKRK